jgi:beta-galactosidase
MLGADELDVAFMPDIPSVPIETKAGTIHGAGFHQSFRPTGGSVAGSYADGTAAMVENGYGAGKTLLIGSFVSLAYGRSPSDGNRLFFRRVLDWADVVPNVCSDNDSLTVRVHEGAAGRRFLWALNPTRRSQKARVLLRGGKAVALCTLWKGGSAGSDGRALAIEVAPEDALVLEVG